MNWNSTVEMLSGSGSPCPYSLEPLKHNGCTVTLMYEQNPLAYVHYSGTDDATGKSIASGALSWRNYTSNRAFRAALKKVVFDPPKPTLKKGGAR